MDWARIQRRLAELEHNPGPIDGIVGRLTRGALRRFQITKRLQATGQIDDATFAALFPLSHDPVRELPWYDEARRLMGTTERPGRANNPVIMDWAKELDIDYHGDDVPWCGLFVAACVASALPDEPLPDNPLGARQWSRFGVSIEDPAEGAVLVFWRGSRAGWKGHVGFCAGHDPTHVHCLGGNQSNQVNIRRIPRSRLLAIRWPMTATAQPNELAMTGRPTVQETDGNEA